MRTELEPKMLIAQERYPTVLQMIMDYADFCNEHGDERLIEYKRLEVALYEMTGKDMSKYNLSEWWEEEGAEVLAFRISLPDAERVDNILKEEVVEIVSFIKESRAIMPSDDWFTKEFTLYLSYYYHALLKVNLKKYKYEHFNRRKEKAGNYSEYTVDEIIDKIWE